MTEDQAAALLADVLQDIAPEVDLGTVDPEQLLQDSLGIDSTDFLTLVAALQRRTGQPISPGDYPKLATVGSLISYLTSAPGGQ